MKRVTLFIMLFSLGLFSIGCTQGTGDTSSDSITGPDTEAPEYEEMLSEGDEGAENSDDPPKAAEEKPTEEPAEDK